MGIAAYNRGSQKISRDLDSGLSSYEQSLVAILDYAKTLPPGPTPIYQWTYLRLDSRGGWWLMDTPEGGWDTYGLYFRSLTDVFKSFAIKAVTYGIDEHSPHLFVFPSEEKELS